MSALRALSDRDDLSDTLVPADQILLHAREMPVADAEVGVAHARVREVDEALARSERRGGRHGMGGCERDGRVRSHGVDDGSTLRLRDMDHY